MSEPFPLTAMPKMTWSWPYSYSVNASIDLNQNGSGTAYAIACQSEHVWANRNYSNQFTKTVVTYTYTSEFQTVISFWDIYTTDSDGFPHARGTEPTAISTYTYTSVSSYTEWVDDTHSHTPFSSPLCSIATSDCDFLWASYSVEEASYFAWSASAEISYETIVENPLAGPICYRTCPMAETSCEVFAESVDLLLWPEVPIDARNNTAVRSFVSDGYTFVSPSVYLSYSTIYAWDMVCDTQYPGEVSSTIVALDPWELSSAVGGPDIRTAVPFNLEDLNGYVSSAAFCEKFRGSFQTCSVIVDDNYEPYLWIPDKVMKLRSEWEVCVPYRAGTFDPPSKLASVEVLTQAATPTSPPAAPLPQIQQPNPPQTQYS